VANSLPKKTGGLNLSHALNKNGGIHSEFTIRREAGDSFYLVSAGALQRLDHDYLKKHMPKDGSVQFTNLTGAIGVLVVAGPKSRQLLERVTKADLSNEAFRWLTSQDIVVGAAPVNAMRVNYVGELGWELHHPIEYQNHIFDALFAVGEDLGLKPFGIRAMDSMRFEKSYRMVGTELSIEYSAFESAMDRFVKSDKGNFLGRDALMASKEAGLKNFLVTLVVSDVTDADALGNNALTRDGELIGRATGGGFGFRIDKSLALGMVRPEFAGPGTEMEIEILGKKYPAVVVPDSPFDTTTERLRDVNGANKYVDRRLPLRCDPIRGYGRTAGRHLLPLRAVPQDQRPFRRCNGGTAPESRTDRRFRSRMVQVIGERRSRILQDLRFECLLAAVTWPVHGNHGRDTRYTDGPVESTTYLYR